METLSVPMNFRSGNSLAIDAVIFFGAVAPAIDVVVADDIEERDEFRRGAEGLGGDLSQAAVTGRVGSSRVKDVDELSQDVARRRRRVWSGISLPALQRTTLG